MFFGMFLFLSNTEEMIKIWLHIPHIARGLIGLRLMRKFPHTHRIAEGMSIPMTEKLHIEDVMNYII
jgi:hypothetical protein